MRDKIMSLVLLLWPIFVYGEHTINRHYSFKYNGTQRSQLFNVSELSFSLFVSDDDLLVSFCGQHQTIAPIHRHVQYTIDTTLDIQPQSSKLSLHIRGPDYLAAPLIFTYSHQSACDGAHKRLLLSTVKETAAESEDDTTTNSTPVLSTTQIDFRRSTEDEKYITSLDLADSAETSATAWYEFYYLGWWTDDDWYTLKYVTALILLLVLILASCLILLALVSCKHRKRTQMHTYSSNPSLKCKNKTAYNAIEQQAHSESDKDDDNDVDRQAPDDVEARAPLKGFNNNNNNNNESGAVELEIVVKANDKESVNEPVAMAASASNGASGHQAQISQVSNKAVATDQLSVSNALPSESDADDDDEDSEEMYVNDNNHAMHTPNNTTVTLTMEPGCIPGSMYAANMTAYGPSRPSITSNNSEETAQTNQSGEGAELYDFELWLKETLQRLFNEDWLIYFRRFKLHKVTDDVLVILCQNEADRSEIWKELFPEVGPQVLFKNAFRKELIRRQLSNTYTPA